MKIRILSIGNKCPSWIKTGFEEYAKRMPREMPLTLLEMQAPRHHADPAKYQQDEAQKLLVPGTIMAEYHKQVGALMEEQLVGLGLISMDDIKTQNPDWPAYKKYFMHGTSHHLGLDVHDVGTMHFPISAGMVFTVEPGIYIPEEGFAVRIENNIVVQENGYLDLMRNIPMEAEEIESLMNR